MFTRKEGWRRLFIAVWCLYFVAVSALTVIDYVEYRNSLLVNVTRYPPELRVRDIDYTIKIIEKSIYGPNEDVDLGGPANPSETRRRRDATYDELIRKDQEEKYSKVLGRLDEFGIDRRKQPFTRDYIKAIKERTRLPEHIINEYPEDAESIYLLLRLERSLMSSVMLRSSFENSPPPKVVVNWRVMVILLLAIPLVIYWILLLSARTVRWIASGFGEKGE